MTPQVLVDTKSAWVSKVNWIAGAGAVLASLNELFPLLPPGSKLQHYATVAIMALTAFLTIYAKTFLTTTISPASLPSVTPYSVVTHSDGSSSDVLNAGELARVKAP